MKLPEEFSKRMKAVLEDSDSFFESFDKEPLKGIRLNKMKVDPEKYDEVCSRITGNTCEKVSWCDCGFYADAGGNDSYYHAGVFYPQEPSAMLPAQVLGVKAGDKVLDLCAAPGGKACRIGEELNGTGLLVANEINADRAKALLRNIERTGIYNAVILNEDPKNMEDKLEGFFDKILIDAPCSGEGMFRRDPNATKSWEKFGPSACVPVQSSILDSASRMLKAGGEIVYSTCTFCMDEDENMIVDFMKRHPVYEVISHPEISGVSHMGEDGILPGSMRIWPHLSRGDGHFCVHLRKTADEEYEHIETDSLPKRIKKRDDNFTYNISREVMLRFMKEILTEDAFRDFKKRTSTDYVLHNGKIHLLPVDEHVFDGLKAVKLGFFPGEVKQTTMEHIFTPSHSLALSLTSDKLRPECVLSLSRDDSRISKYLKGETVSLTDEEADRLIKKGTIIIAVDSFPLGFGKMTGRQIKNMYPKAWRIV